MRIRTDVRSRMTRSRAVNRLISYIMTTNPNTTDEGMDTWLREGGFYDPGERRSMIAAVRGRLELGVL